MMRCPNIPYKTTNIKIMSHAIRIKMSVPNAPDDALERINEVRDTYRAILQEQKNKWSHVEESDSNETTVSDTLSTNTKYRIVAVLDTNNSEVRLGVNGSVVDSTATSDNFSTGDDTHMVGYARARGDRHFSGAIDEPMVSFSAWDSQEIQDDYNRQPWS